MPGHSEQYIEKINIHELNSEYIGIIDNVIKLESHIRQLHADWVVDLAEMQHVMSSLDQIVRDMSTVYNENLRNASYSRCREKISGELQKEFYFLDLLENKKSGRPEEFLYSDIKSSVLSIAEQYGYINMSGYFEMVYGPKYQMFCDDIPKFELYDKIFHPYCISTSDTPKSKNAMNIRPIAASCDSLINNTCTIELCIGSLGITIKYTGYILLDKLNIYHRTSQVYSELVSKKKQQVRHILSTKYKHVSNFFASKYMKLNCCVRYFICTPAEIAECISNAENTLVKIKRKSIEYFVSKISRFNFIDIYDTINLLLLDGGDSVTTASVLFEILESKNLPYSTLRSIIYKTLPFSLQEKLEYKASTIAVEKNRLSKLCKNDIPIDSKILSLPNLPDQAITYVMSKKEELSHDENNYKATIAIDGVLNFPWKPKNYVSEYDSINKSATLCREYLSNISDILDKNIYGQLDAKNSIIELVGRWISNPESSGHVIGLEGPPGTGKTLLAKSISSALDIPLSIIGCGGANDVADILGHSYTYSNAQYGMIIRQMIKMGKWRSILFFDELDKVSGKNGINEIYNSLLHITDPNMNQNFQDRFYSTSIDFDLSGTLVIFSYNDKSKIDKILLDRITSIRIVSYNTNDKMNIAKKYVLPKLCKSVNIDISKISISDSVIENIITNHTCEAGMRTLEKKLNQIITKLNVDRMYSRGPFVHIINKMAHKNASDKSEPESDSGDFSVKNIDPEILDKVFNLDIDDVITIDAELVSGYLGSNIRYSTKINSIDMIGVVNGLYATDMGVGGITPIQIYKNYSSDNSGNGTGSMNLRVTGNQKKVMKESVQCAFTVALSALSDDAKFNVASEFPNGFHVHVPDGGTPKDGPSAGCAFATAFVSVMLGKKINRKIAMTGEIELTGKVSKIGGLSEKLSGAKMAGVETVYICRDNQHDYHKHSEKNPGMYENFRVVVVDNISDIIKNKDIIIGAENSDYALE